MGHVRRNSPSDSRRDDLAYITRAAARFPTAYKPRTGCRTTNRLQPTPPTACSATAATYTRTLCALDYATAPQTLGDSLWATLLWLPRQSVAVHPMLSTRRSGAVILGLHVLAPPRVLQYSLVLVVTHSARSFPTSAAE